MNYRLPFMIICLLTTTTLSSEDTDWNAEKTARGEIGCWTLAQEVTVARLAQAAAARGQGADLESLELVLSRAEGLKNLYEEFGFEPIEENAKDGMIDANRDALQTCWQWLEARADARALLSK